MTASTLKSAQFRAEREQSWRELDSTLAHIRARGLADLSAEELHRLPSLYRSAVSSLSVARAISLDKNLLEYLEGLVSRAYILVYTDKRPPWDMIRDFFVSRFPRAVFQHRWYLAVSLGLILAGALCSFAITLADQSRYSSFVPDAMAQGRTPESSTESLREVLYTNTDDVEGLSYFASALFTHNAGVGIMCFCLGFVAAAPTVILLFYNGLILGAMAALYHSRGLGGDFMAWIMGHGVTEIGAIALCGAAGLVLGRAVLFPGRTSRLASLARGGRAVAPIMVGIVFMFLIAGLLEGYFRQLSSTASIRWLMAGGTLVVWVCYFFWRGQVVSSSRNA